jgi:murein DD-endopeptidase MepM/ murein hydrolase activator NlpD
MGLKHHTVIVVPHSRARFRKFRITNRQVAVTVGVVVFLLVASAFTTWSYFTIKIDESELALLDTENEELRQVNQGFETSIRKLQKQLVDFEDRTRQLAIVAGLDGLTVSQETGVGGSDIPASIAAPGATLDTMQERAAALANELEAVTSQLDERFRLISSTPAIAPVKGLLTSGYGWRRDPYSGERALHQAIDISTSPGKPVLAAADGIVVEAERNGRLGKAVYLSHGYGLTTRYGHLSRFNVSPGQRVKRGDTIGYVGNTGRATGYHLHYEVRLDGRPVNPLGYILDGTSNRS